MWGKGVCDIWEKWVSHRDAVVESATEALAMEGVIDPLPLAVWSPAERVEADATAPPPLP